MGCSLRRVREWTQRLDSVKRAHLDTLVTPIAEGKEFLVGLPSSGGPDGVFFTWIVIVRHPALGLNPKVGEVGRLQAKQISS